MAGKAQWDSDRLLRLAVQTLAGRLLPCRSAGLAMVRALRWYDPRVYALLERYGVALCLHDMQGSASERLVVGPFIYVRFHHGTTKYGGRY